MSAPVQFSLRSEPKPNGGVSLLPPASIFATASAGNAPTPSKVKVAPIPLPASRADSSDDTPLLLRNVNPDVLAAADKDKCRIDMASRPDAPDMAAYERVPVHEFGYAIMAGMGWSKGKPIGRSNPQVVEPFEYLRRPHLLGLGAQPTPAELDLPSMTGKKRKKQSAPELIDPKTGKTRYRKGIDEVLEERDRPIGAGDRVRIDSGPHAALTGVVNAIADDCAEIALDLNHKPVRVAVRDLSRCSERADAPADTGRSSTCALRDLTWVVPDLIVRVVSKSRRWQKWYSCKGRVYDIVSKSQFTMMIDGVLVDDVTEADVETVVPDRPGVRLRIVAGKYKDQYARLYRRMVDKGKAKVDLDNGDRVAVRLDDVSQVAD